MKLIPSLILTVVLVVIGLAFMAIVFGSPVIVTPGGDWYLP